MKLAKILLSTLLLFSIATAVLAEGDTTLPEAGTLPGSSSYLFKRLGEKVKWFFTFNQKSKFEYQKRLVETRLSELKSLVENDKTDQIEDAGQRFAYQVGIQTETVKNNDQYKKGVVELYSKYIPLLEKLRDHYPANKTYWLVLQQDIDTLNILAGVLR